MRFGFKTYQFQARDQGVVRGNHFTRGAISHFLDENEITVHFVEYHDVLHPAKRLDWKTSSLVGVHLLLEIAL